MKSLWGFPHSSIGKESSCNAGDPGSIPGSGRYLGEGRGYSLQYSGASLVIQLVKNPPIIRKTWVQSLGWEDPLEKGKATHSSILAWRIPWTIQSLGSQRVKHDWVTFTFFFHEKLTVAFILNGERLKGFPPRSEKRQRWLLSPLLNKQSPANSSQSH